MTPTTSYRLPVQLHRAADDRTVAAETPLPQAVTEHHNLVASRFVLASSERPTHDRGHAEEIEQIGGDLAGPLSALAALRPPASRAQACAAPSRSNDRASRR